eukprot:3280924-Rhodomonas_salina.1
MPESLKPWKGKWSGPRAGAPLICTVPATSSSEIVIASSMFCVKICAAREGCEAVSYTHLTLPTICSV